MLLSEGVISAVRKEMRKFAEGIRIENEEISEIIEHEVLKREIVEGEEAQEAQKKLKKHLKKTIKTKPKVIKKPVEPKVEDESLTVTERLLKESENNNNN